MPRDYTFELIIKTAFPKARVMKDPDGKVWINDGDGRVIGTIQTTGTWEYRRRMAWLSAAEEFGQHIKAQCKFFNNGKC